ncbi:MAG: dTDP-4-dehydrorhamnose reductase [Actinomycetes bacterium]
MTPPAQVDGRWLVIGHRGMLGTDLMTVLHDRDVVGLDLPDIDITNAASVDDAVTGFDIVVNCAAYTAVDAAEEDEDLAFAVNAVGPEHIARACARTGAWMTHISTDYVFDGTATTPYPEDAAMSPRTAYGRTKAAGEQAVRRINSDRSHILRTAWLYGAHGPNFVRTMIALEQQRDTLEVVSDQHGQPTWSHDVATRLTLALVRGVPAGTFHATSSGATTWFEFTQRIFTMIGADTARVLPTTTAKFPRPAPRPAYSVLGHDAWSLHGLGPMRDWNSAFEAAWPSFTSAES